MAWTSDILLRPRPGLSRPEGASGRHIAEAVGWPPHTIRGFLAGLAKKGIKVDVLERVRQVGPNKQGAKGSSKSTTWLTSPIEMDALMYARVSGNMGRNCGGGAAGACIVCGMPTCHPSWPSHVHARNLHLPPGNEPTGVPVLPPPPRLLRPRLHL
jgi:uncharacterized protein DUF3489